MRNGAQRVGRSETLKLLIFDPLDQLVALWSEDGVGTEMVDERIGVEEYMISSREIGE